MSSDMVKYAAEAIFTADDRADDATLQADIDLMGNIGSACVFAHQWGQLLGFGTPTKKRGERSWWVEGTREERGSGQY
jgi:hypothetical protein